MKKLSSAIVVVAVFGLLSASAGVAQAAGFVWYSSSPRNQTSYYGSSNFTYGNYPTNYKTNKVYLQPRDYYGYGDDDHAWHDTSHLHYRPAALQRHGNHYHYVPSHYEVHETGHWDHLHD